MAGWHSVGASRRDKPRSPPRQNSQRWTDGSPTSQTSGIRESTTTHATLHLGFLLPVFPKIHLEEELVRLSSDSVLGRLVPHEVGILQPFLRTPPCRTITQPRTVLLGSSAVVLRRSSGKDPSFTSAARSRTHLMIRTRAEAGPM